MSRSLSSSDVKSESVQPVSVLFGRVRQLLPDLAPRRTPPAFSVFTPRRVSSLEAAEGPQCLKRRNVPPADSRPEHSPAIHKQIVCTRTLAASALPSATDRPVGPWPQASVAGRRVGHLAPPHGRAEQLQASALPRATDLQQLLQPQSHGLQVIEAVCHKLPPNIQLVLPRLRQRLLPPLRHRLALGHDARSNVERVDELHLVAWRAAVRARCLHI